MQLAAGLISGAKGNHPDGIFIGLITFLGTSIGIELWWRREKTRIFELCRLPQGTIFVDQANQLTPKIDFITDLNLAIEFQGLDIVSR